MDNVVIREAVLDDWQEAGRICYEAFATLADRHGFPHDFPTIEAAALPIKWMIEHPKIYGLVAEKDGRVVGSNFLDERSSISAMGPISIDPSIQDAGIGRALTAAVIERAQRGGAIGIRLVQIAYHNRSLSLYSKLGFDVKAEFAAMYGQPLGLELPGYEVRKMTRDDVAACNALCARVHGYDRGVEVAESVEAGCGRVVERLGGITGYTTGISYFAHSVAETNDDLIALIGEAEECGTPGFLIPLSNGELFRWCLYNGFRVFFVVNLMTIGMYQEPATLSYMPSVGY